MNDILGVEMFKKMRYNLFVNIKFVRKGNTKMKKILLLLMGAFLLTGCGSDREKVVIYSSMEEERNQALKEQLEEKFELYDVVVQAVATGNSAAKIKNEGSNIEADIVLDLETAHMANLEDNFALLSDFDSSMFLDGINNSENYFTWVKYTMNLIIDNKYFKEHNLSIPETYEDLLKKEYKGLIAMPDPKTSGTGYGFFLNAVNIMGEDKAIEYFNKLKNNMREFTTSGSGPTNLLKQGEIAIAMGMTNQGVEAINAGYDYTIVELKTGSPYNTTSFGIIKGHEDKAGVKEVFEWILTDFSRYDKEHFMPDQVLKNQKISVKNYPLDLTYADMMGIDDMKVKEHLTKMWGKVNG